jgi:hypothetical protein
VISSIVVIGLIIGTVVGQSINNFRADLPEYAQRLESISSSVRSWLGNFGLTIDTQQWRQSVNPGPLPNTH